MTDQTQPEQSDMVEMGESLVEAARGALANEFGWSHRLKAAVAAWDSAMVDRFVSAVEEMDRRS